MDGMDAVLRLPLLDTGQAREERGRTPAATATEAIVLERLHPGRQDSTPRP